MGQIRSLTGGIKRLEEEMAQQGRQQKGHANLQRLYTRLQKKRGSGKAIIATAQKFLGIIYRTLKYDWIFEDFPNFVLAKP